MKRSLLLAATAVIGGTVAFQGSVNLQATTPGSPQTGHLNISGTAKAGSIVGYNNTPTGQTFGGDFRAASNEGRALLGNASSTTGATYGGLFQNFSNAGRGVAGLAQNSSGTTYGGFFSSLSSSGRGLYGQATSLTGTTYGVYGKAVSPTGYGVYSEGNMSATGVISGNGSGLTGVNADLLDGINSTAFLQAIPNPLTLSGTSATHIIRGENASTAHFSTGVYGVSTAATGITSGGYFRNDSQDGRGVFGVVTDGTGTTYGGRFESASTSGFGVYGQASALTGSTYGVWGRSNSTDGRGVRGLAAAATGVTYGVFGESASTEGTGVAGWATAANGTTYGVWGQSDSQTGTGVVGWATATTGTTIGVYGTSDSVDASAYGVFAQGNLGASGTKTFRIDHPFDPENKYLLHYCAESPMPQNFYVGNVVTDSKGYAWVELPDYFNEININFKYQLTVVDDADSNAFVQAKVSKKIRDGRFQIRTSAPNTEVSWRVDADRNDLYVRNRPPKDVVVKEWPEKGTYQHPEFYGLGPERGMNYDPSRAKKPIKPKAK